LGSGGRPRRRMRKWRQSMNTLAWAAAVRMWYAEHRDDILGYVIAVPVLIGYLALLAYTGLLLAFVCWIVLPIGSGVLAHAVARKWRRLAYPSLLIWAAGLYLGIFIWSHTYRPTIEDILAAEHERPYEFP
jgi:hypothetical protein